MLSLANAQFSLAAVLVTASLARESGAPIAAAVLAGYSVQSIAVTAARGYFVTAPIYRHVPAHELCRGDIRHTAQRLTSAAVLTFVLCAATTLSLSQSFSLAGATGAWCASMLALDVARQSLAVFGSARLAVAALSVFLCCAAVVTVYPLPGGAPITLALTAGVAAAFSACMFWLLLRSTTAASCSFWSEHRGFSRSLAWEGVVAVSAISLTQVVIARAQPELFVGWQIANQIAVAPALLAISGLSAPLIRRIRARGEVGGKEWPLLSGWALLHGFALVGAVSAAFLLSSAFTRLYGEDAWLSALSLLAPHAAYAGTIAVSYALLTRYRSRLPPREVRRSWIALQLLAQTVILGWTFLRLPGGLAAGLIAAATIGALCTTTQMLHWELRHKAKK